MALGACRSSERLVLGVKPSKYGAVDPTGDIVVPIEYDSLGIFVEGLAVARLGDRFGYIDSSNEWAVEPVYEVAATFSDGLALVGLDGQLGYIDRDGRPVVPFQYDQATSFVNGMAAVAREGKVGYIDKTGRLRVPHFYDNISYYSEGLIGVQTGERWGYVDADNNVVFGFEFLDAKPFHDGVAFVGTESGYGYINRDGRLIAEPILDYTRSEWFAPVSGLDVFEHLVGYAGDSEDSMRLAPFITGISRVSQGRIMIAVNDQYGFVDVSGTVQIAPQYDFAYPFIRGTALVRDGDLYMLIDLNGEVVIRLDEFTDVVPRKGRYLSATDPTTGKRLLLNSNGDRVTEPIYDRILSFEDGYAQIERDGKWGVIDGSGKEIIAPKYDYVSPLSEGHFIVAIDE